MKNIAVIGLGSRISHMLEQVLKFSDGQFRVTAIADVQSKGELKVKHPNLVQVVDDARLYSNYADLLENEKLDGVLVGTRCSIHAKIAEAVIKLDIPLFLEKPVATTIEDLKLLYNCHEKHNYKTVVSFPLRTSPLIEQVKSIIESGKTGQIEHVQAFNYVPYGGVYYHSWYRDKSETGGLFLQKATHDFDYINYLLGIKPVQIVAMESNRIFKGDKPFDLKCKDCSEYKTCTESPYVRENYYYDSDDGTMCCFCKINNHDSASTIIRYETGMHAAYTQNLFARRGAAKRGAILSGHKGTVEFDWYKDEIFVYHHKQSWVETYKLDAADLDHFGGDTVLCRNFVDVVNGESASKAPLYDGLMSALMCLMANKSVETNTFVDINF